jgi:HSP20 family protein
MAFSLRRLEERPLDLWRENSFLSNFERRMESLFDEVFDGDLVSYATPELRGIFYPRIDVRETGHAFKISAEIPGMRQEDIDVSVHDGVLSISGEKKVEKDEKDVNYQHVERAYGSFCRDVSLPDSVDSERIEATYKNGVLHITLLKTEKAMKESRKIPVTTA